MEDPRYKTFNKFHILLSGRFEGFPDGKIADLNKEADKLVVIYGGVLNNCNVIRMKNRTDYLTTIAESLKNAAEAPPVTEPVRRSEEAASTSQASPSVTASSSGAPPPASPSISDPKIAELIASQVKAVL